MFTGIIEEIGQVKKIARRNRILKLEISAPKTAEDISTGDSVSCDGVCLTATAAKNGLIGFDVMEATYKNTTLKSFTRGRRVNLEKALAAGARLGGHFVTGHVDGERRVIRFKRGNGDSMTLSLNPGDSKFVVEKGSIAIDGVSLTIAKGDKKSLTVNLIPHTLSATTLGAKRRGDLVNVEFDILRKSQMPGKGTASGSLTRQKLEDAGFI